MSVLYLMSKILSLTKDLSCVCFFCFIFFVRALGFQMKTQVWLHNNSFYNFHKVFV